MISMARLSDSPVPERMRRAIGEVEKRCGAGTLMTFEGQGREAVEVISTGSFALDRALGVGGLPRGRVVEIFGPESTGKTSLALSVVAQAQRRGGLCAFVDAEHALDLGYAEKLGVDTAQLMISQPDYGEQALEVVDILVSEGAADLIIVDSVAALVPKAEIDGEMTDLQVGLQARLMSKALRKITAHCARSRTTVIFINQIRMKIGVMFGSPETTPGGQALKFFSSVRLDIRRTGHVKEGETVLGNKVKVKVVKNKVAPPFAVAELELWFDRGISRTHELFDLGVEAGLIAKSGSWYSLDGERLGQGRDRSVEALRTAQALSDRLEERLSLVLHPGRGADDDANETS